MDSKKSNGLKAFMYADLILSACWEAIKQSTTEHRPVQGFDWAGEPQSSPARIFGWPGSSFHRTSSNHEAPLWSGCKMLSPGNGSRVLQVRNESRHNQNVKKICKMYVFSLHCHTHIGEKIPSSHNRSWTNDPPITGWDPLETHESIISTITLIFWKKNSEFF